jgi:HK97 family phage portal protein
LPKLIKRFPKASVRQASRPETRDRIAYQSYAYNGSAGTYSVLGAIQNVPPAERVALTLAAIVQAVNIYANAIANLDFYVAEKDGDGHRQAYDHPIYDLVHTDPNPWQTSFEYRRTAMVQACLRGNHYSEISRNGRGRATGLHAMCPVSTEPIKKPSGEVVYRTPSGEQPGMFIELPACDVLHIKFFDFDGIKGLSPVQLMARGLGLAVNQEEYASNTMVNMAVPQGYLKIPGSNKDDVKAQRNRADWQSLHGGPQNAGKVAMLYGGMEWVQTQFSPADTELIKSREFSISDIARVYNLHPYSLGIGVAPTDMEAVNRDFFTGGISPWVTQWEQQMTKKLIGERERRYYYVNGNDRVRGAHPGAK